MPEVEVPAVEGETLQNATNLGRGRIKSSFSRSNPSETVPAGMSSAELPVKGKGREIDLTISGPELVKVENVVGKCAGKQP